MRTFCKAMVVAGALSAGMAHAEEKFEPTFSLAAEQRYDSDQLLRGPNGNGELLSKLSPQVGLSLKDHTLTSEGWYAADLLFRPGLSTGRLNVDHRGALSFNKELSERTTIESKFQVFRVTDPLSLPRLGIARDLAPVLYGRADVIARQDLSPRWFARVGYRFEGAKIYDVTPTSGLMHAPFAEAIYKASRRTEIGLQYRLQYFVSGNDVSNAQGVFGVFTYRLTAYSTFKASAGPIFYRTQTGVGQGFVPYVNLELSREFKNYQFSLIAGHDLVGASGFASALWADYAGLDAAAKLSMNFKLFGAASYYRNGQPPNQGFNPFSTTPLSQGYALGGGLEWSTSRNVSFQLTVNRLYQIATGPEILGVDLSRTIAAARIIVSTL